MAISFPLDLILEGEGWRCTRFAIGNAQNIGQSGGGTMPVVEVGNDLWMASYEIGPLKPTAYDRMMARVQALRGSMFSFLGWDCTRCRPIAYPAGVALPADVQGRLTAVSQGHILTVDQVTAGFAISAGDYLRATMNGNRYLFQAVENVTANGSGVLNTFDVRPYVPANWVLNSAVIFNKPQCLMRIVSGTLQGVRGPSGFGSINFDAIQVLSET
jgi:hypothetical protein